jgi:hypothetical protein
MVALVLRATPRGRLDRCVTGGAGGPGWGGDQRCCPAVRSFAADGVCLAAALCAGWGGAESGGPFVASAWVSSDGAGSGGAGVGVA